MDAEADAGEVDAASTASFSSDHARDVLADAGRAIKLNSEEAQLLQFGENATFRLEKPATAVVVRIARGLSRLPVAQREVCVSRWLAESGVPTVCVDERFADQPLGFPVLRAARELGMTTWLAQNVGESHQVSEEIALRVASLREGD